ncbi:MAG: hypothetical protein RSF00_10125, partial [Oscillospiraceae bacterium]
SICRRRAYQIFIQQNKRAAGVLVDRKGVYCSNGEIIGALWEDDSDSVKKSSYLRDLKADLLAAFTSLDMEDAICKQRGMMAVSVERLACDYYSWMQGDIEAINAYRGEYMSQYSWGEFTLGSIEMSVTTSVK